MDDINSILKVALKLAIERIVSETVGGDKPLDHYTGMLAGANEMLTCALATLDATKTAPLATPPISACSCIGEMYRNGLRVPGVTCDSCKDARKMLDAPAAPIADMVGVLTASQMRAIAKVIARRVAQNTGKATELCFAPALLGLQEYFGAPNAQEAEHAKPEPVKFCECTQQQRARCDFCAGFGKPQDGAVEAPSAVCPARDAECGDSRQAWCATCPKWLASAEHAAPDTPPARELANPDEPAPQEHGPRRPLSPSSR